MEPTPLNPLIKEYVNLAFHGMRASKEPINVDIDLKLDENVNEVPIIAEDFSRVILNLVNNAFDAMREKLSEKAKVKSERSNVKGKKSPFEGGADPSVDGEVGDVTEFSYHPKLTIRTHQEDTTVTIEIEDNGPGIPDEIKDKILQPFFTTKKGTAGTGLGLSITNDIVKAHGGKIDLESVEGEKTLFIINFPI
jgi:signal transduction histidine kinase